MAEKKEMLLEKQNETAITVAEADVVTGENDESLVVYLKKPYLFEGKTYTEIDLSGMEDMIGSDMIAINRIMSGTASGVDVMPEVTTEYACYFAARATKLPVEFFLQLTPRALMKVKSRVMGFLFGSD